MSTTATYPPATQKAVSICEKYYHNEDPGEIVVEQLKHGEISITTRVHYKDLSTLVMDLVRLRFFPCFCEGNIRKEPLGINEKGEPVYLHYSTYLKIAFINTKGGKA